MKISRRRKHQEQPKEKTQVPRRRKHQEQPKDKSQIPRRRNYQKQSKGKNSEKSCRARRQCESQLTTAAPLESSTLRWTPRENVLATWTYRHQEPRTAPVEVVYV